jgi:hypothetical protein
LDTVKEALELSLFLVLLVFVPLGVQVGALYGVTRTASSRVVRAFGWRGLLVFSWVGTPIHELSHALLVLATGGRLTKVNLFKANQATGELGSVSYTYKSRAPVRKAMVAVAPLAGGTLALIAVSYLLLPDVLRIALDGPGLDAGEQSLVEMVATLASNLIRTLGRVFELLSSREVLARWQTWLWAYLAICIGSRLSPSSVDWRQIRPAALIGAGLCVLGGIALALWGRFGGTLDGPLGARRALARTTGVVVTVNGALSVTLLFCVFASLVLILAALPFGGRGRGRS